MGQRGITQDDEQLGKDGEAKARLLLKQKGYEITQIDWLGVRDNKIYRFEIKAKSRRFNPPPFEGHGLDLHQVKRFLKFQELTKIRIVLVVWEKWHDQWIWGFLDELENSDQKCIAPFGQIRIYNINLFKPI